MLDFYLLDPAHTAQSDERTILVALALMLIKMGELRPHAYTELALAHHVEMKKSTTRQHHLNDEQ